MAFYCYKKTPCKNCKYYQLNEEEYACFRQQKLSQLIGKKIHLETLDGRKSYGLVSRIDEYGLLYGDWGRYAISEEQINLILED